MRFAAIEQFQMKVATRFVGKALKKLLRQPEAEGRGHVLFLFRSRNLFERQLIHAAPGQKRTAAEIHDASGQALIHRHVCFRSERVPRVESRAVPANPLLVAQRLQESLSQGNPAVLDGVMGVHVQVPFAAQRQIGHGVPGEEREHVVKKRNAGFDQGLPPPVNVQLDKNTRLLRDALDLSVPNVHKPAR